MATELTDHWEELYEDLERARADKKEATDREKVARDALLSMLRQQGETEAITASGSGVRIVLSVRKSVDSRKLEALYPDIFNQCSKESEITTLKLF